MPTEKSMEKAREILGLHRRSTGSVLCALSEAFATALDAAIAETREGCARLIEENIIVTTNLDDAGPQHLSPRRAGNTEGLFYASAIRATGKESER